MRLFGPGSFSTSARILLEALIVLIGVYLAVEVLISAGMFLYMKATTTVAGQPTAFPLGLWLTIAFPLGTILSGLAVVIVAELFRAGADLQDDQALTV